LGVKNRDEVKLVKERLSKKISATKAAADKSSIARVAIV
jgi:hypothetical protein